MLGQSFHVCLDKTDRVSRGLDLMQSDNIYPSDALYFYIAIHYIIELPCIENAFEKRQYTLMTISRIVLFKKFHVFFQTLNK